MNDRRRERAVPASGDLSVRLFDGALRSIASSDRNAFIDYLRGVAIISVILFHSSLLHYGYLGVDLFFVISGYLVSKRLVDAARRGEPIRVAEFIAFRAVKIWPSYYFFIAVGGLLGAFLYSASHPGQVISAAHLPRYLFFFQNYRGTPHWTFDHVWSLCVEEHFYILLPCLFWAVHRSGKPGLAPTKRLVAALIVAGWLGRLAGAAVGFETHSATHNRLDALGWGVLLRLLKEEGPFADSPPNRLVAAGGAALLFAAILVHKSGWSAGFNLVAFHGLVPFACFLVMLGGEFQSKLLTPLRFAAYYTYNWYLWHTLFWISIKDSVGNGAAGLSLYFLVGLAAAVLVTRLVEEPVMARRDAVLGWLRARLPRLLPPDRSPERAALGAPLA